jgi:hypothetical protein
LTGSFSLIDKVVLDGLINYVDIFEVNKYHISFKKWLTETDELIVSCGMVTSVVVDELSNIANFFLSKSEG